MRLTTVADVAKQERLLRRLLGAARKLEPASENDAVVIETLRRHARGTQVALAVWRERLQAQHTVIARPPGPPLTIGKE